MQWDYPAIEGVEADLLLVTHEHVDHNAVEVDRRRARRRSARPPARSSRPSARSSAVASEHDEAAGTERGPNTIFVFALDGLRVAHFGDFGQRALRDEQAAAIGEVDLLFLPVGGGPTAGAEQAARSSTAGPRGSCRCTTAPRGSASWSPPTTFLDRFARGAAPPGARVRHRRLSQRRPGHGRSRRAVRRRRATAGVGGEARSWACDPAPVDVEQAIRTRRTHKAFGSQPVPQAVLDELLELARWAPNHNLTNPALSRARATGAGGVEAGRGCRAGGKARPRPNPHRRVGRADRRSCPERGGR